MCLKQKMVLMRRATKAKQMGAVQARALMGLAVALPMALPDNADFAEANKRNRVVGAEWVLKGCPLRDLVLTRVTMEPSMTVLRQQLHRGSHRWESDQDCGLLGGRRRAAQGIQTSDMCAG